LILLDDVTRTLEVSAASLAHMAARVEHEYRRERRQVGKKERLLCIPSPRLMMLQDRLYERVLLPIPLSGAVYSIIGGGPAANARVHYGHAYVLIEDIHNCFPSVRPNVVRNALVLHGFEPQLAGLIMRLCTAFGSLPQGAPTSSRLLDLVLAPIDEHLTRAAAVTDCTYSRYVDDITISSDRPIGWIREAIPNALRSVGLTLSSEKTRYYRSGQIPTVTGVVLAGELRPRKSFLRDLSIELRRAARGENRLSLHQLSGRVAWVQHLNPSMGAEFQRYLARCNRKMRAGRVKRLASQDGKGRVPDSLHLEVSF
jgi:RNA-directed DNA polymerase